MKKHGLAVGGMIMVVTVAIISGCASPSMKVSTIPTEITSTPPGATITLDGCVLGTTPFTSTIRKKPNYAGPATMSGTAPSFRDAVEQIERAKRAANYTFVATKDGYIDFEKEFIVNDGIPTAIHFDLSPQESPSSK